MDTPFGRRWRAGLSFQARLTLVAATAVAVPVIVATIACYFVARSALEGQVNEGVRQRAVATHIESLGQGRPPGLRFVTPPDPSQSGGYAQLVTSDGSVVLPENGTVRLPVSPLDLQVASGDAAPYWRDDVVDGVPVRMYTTMIFRDVAVTVARPLTETNSILNLLELVLTGVAAGGIALAAVLGRLIAQTGLRPISRLRAAVDHVADTSDMSERVPEGGNDELGLLGAHFNRMLRALEQSLLTQRQLVADASHELRTPLASLRTNVEVLQRSPALPVPERQRMLEDVVFQVEQLTRLIQDLIDLARGDQAPEEREEVRLDWVVSAAVERAARHWPAIRFDSELAESVVLGQANRLDRAVSNLLDNAGKWSAPGQAVEVRLTDHELTVRDHGPGIAPDDLPHVFDRFWRAATARGLPGSGLGLSIVRQVADAHRATVTAELPPDGGTLMRLRFADS